MPTLNPLFRPLETLAIVGVGLMGGSLALAARQAGVARNVIGLGRHQERLDDAVRRGILDSGTTSAADLRGAQLIVVCTPVDRIVADVIEIAATVGPGPMLTDVGSVKGAICEELTARLPQQFVGSHPLAGSEKGGYENSEARLYQHRLCVVTPLPTTPDALVQQVVAFWSSLGMRTRLLEPQEHDRILALTSHVPHVAAAALAAMLPREAAPFAATGFQDTTRVAGGDADLWTAILQLNSQHVQQELERLVQQLLAFQNALRQHDGTAITQLLAAGRAGRQVFEAAFAEPQHQE